MEQTTHPILFQPEMVQAILEDRKTQTRRIIKDSFNGCWTGANGTIQVGGHPCPNDPIIFHPGEIWTNEEGEQEATQCKTVEAWFMCSTMDKIAKCPYGKIGDLLWVRETCQILGQWVKNGLTDTGKQRWTFVIHPDQEVRYFGSFEPSPKDRTELGFYTRPAIHCPSWTSRITLEITDIRAERLQSISESDAIAEGIKDHSFWSGIEYLNYLNEEWESNPIRSYLSLWDKINGSDAHKINPWVWAVTFKRIKP